MTVTTGIPVPTIGLIGYGAIAQMHVDALASLGVRPVVVAGPSRDAVDAFAAAAGIPRSTTDVDAVLRDPGIGAVILASPSGVHAAQAAAALADGKHVLVEIPLALSLADGERLVALAAAHGRVLAVCHTLRYWSPFDALHAWIADAGHRVRHVVARALSLRLENVGWTGRQRTWTDDLLWHHGGHVIDEVLRLLPGSIDRIEAAVGPVWEASGLPMDYGIALHTTDGAIATIALSYTARQGAGDYWVITDRDTAVVAGAEVRTSGGVLVSGAVADVQVAAVRAQDADFLAAIAEGRQPIASADAILPTLRIQQAVADKGPLGG